MILSLMSLIYRENDVEVFRWVPRHHLGFGNRTAPVVATYDETALNIKLKKTKCLFLLYILDDLSNQFVICIIILLIIKNIF